MLPKSISTTTQSSEEIQHNISITFSDFSINKILCGPCLGMACCREIPFGLHHWSVSYQFTDTVENPPRTIQKESGQLFCSSSLYDFLTTTDALLDEFVWGWAYGGCYTDSLENSLLELLIASNDELETTVRSWQPMMAVFSGMEQETSRLVEMIRSDLSLALTLKEKAGYAVGRLHQNLLQLIDSGNGLLGLPPIFIDACKSFLIGKVTTSPQSLLHDRIKAAIPSLQCYLVSSVCGDLERSRLQTSLARILSFVANLHLPTAIGMFPFIIYVL